MKRGLPFVLAVVVAVLVPVAAFAETEAALPPTAQAMPERVAGEHDAAAAAWRMQQLHDWLAAERVEEAQETPVIVHFDREQLRALAGGECESCGNAKKLLIGATAEVAVPVDLAGLQPATLRQHAVRLPHGAVRGMADGGFVWSGVAVSEGASALRLHIADFSLPEGSELYVYNDSGQAFGPYTGEGPLGNGDFWTNTVASSRVFLQLRHFGTTSPEALARSSFVIADVGHIDPGAFRPAEQTTYTTGLCGYNAECIVNRMCVSGEPSFVDQDLAYAIAHYQFVKKPWIYICSGGLVADLDTSTAIPYFLTANHCLSTSKAAATVEAYFQYWTSGCGGACYNPEGATPRVLGATLVKTNATGDYTLLKLNAAAPPGSVFLGWSTAPVASTDGAMLYRVSHPQGAPQAYSEHQVDITAGTCTGWPRGSWIYSRDVVGATEGGSSGSPVVNAAGQIVGQLSGACGTNVNDSCDSVSNATVDGAFASYYGEVEPYLAAGGGGGGSDVITLSAKAYIDKNKKKVDLTWSGSTATSIDVFRNGALIVTTPNDGFHTDSVRSAGTYTYKVCNAGTTTCSNTATVTF